MYRFSETICHWYAAAGIAFATVMATKDVKVVTTIRALFDATDPLFSRIGHKVVLEQMMDFTCASLEVGAV